MLTTENTIGFNQEQLDGLNEWVNRQLSDEPDYEEIQKYEEKALNFYQEILGDAGIDYDDE